MEDNISIIQIYCGDGDISCIFSYINDIIDDIIIVDLTSDMNSTDKIKIENNIKITSACELGISQTKNNKILILDAILQDQTYRDILNNIYSTKHEVLSGNNFLFFNKSSSYSIFDLYSKCHDIDFYGFPIQNIRCYKLLYLTKLCDCNYNPFSSANLLCNKDYFKKIILDDSTKYDNIYFQLIKKYNITEEEHLVILFYILFYDYKRIKEKNDNNINLVISFYNEINLTRIFELILCLLYNLENTNISKVHILYENKDNDSLIGSLMNFIFDNISFIKCINITERPTFKILFDYCDKNIRGITIISNADIIYDDTLSKIKDMKRYHFLSISRKNKIVSDGSVKWEIISSEKTNNKKNIFSHDTWIFISPMKYIVSNHKHIGSFFCDIVMSFLLSKTNYKCYNLPYDINCFHIQKNMSYGQYIDADESLVQKEWNDTARLLRNKNFCFGLRITSINDLLEDKNASIFVSWNEWITEAE